MARMNLDSKRKGSLLVLCTIIASGCGGGSTSGGGAPLGPAQPLNVGDAKVSFIGTAKPAILTYESGLTFSSLGGGSVTGFTVYPNTVLSNTTIAYVTAGGGAATYQRGTTQATLEIADELVEGVAFGHDGHLYSAQFSDPYDDSLVKSYFDGSVSTGVYFGNDGVASNPVVSTSGTTLAADFTLGYGVFTCNSTGGAFKNLDSTGAEPSFSADGSNILYVKKGTGSFSSYYQVYEIPTIGGTPTQYSESPANFYYPIYTPDGTSVICDYDNGSYRSLIVLDPGTGNSWRFLTPQSGWASHASLSPDGQYVVYSYSSSYSHTQTSIVIQPIDGSTTETIGTGYNPVWSPYPASREFIGGAPVMFTSAAGFVYAQQQNGFQSFVAFLATTPSAATVTLDNQTGAPSGGPVVYDLHADKITSLKYANLYYDTPAGIVPATSDVLVTFDSTAGTVDAVAPFLATRGGKPTCVKANGTLTYSGHFTGVWNAGGKNVAPAGASKMVLDSKSGKLLSAS